MSLPSRALAVGLLRRLFDGPRETSTLSTDAGFLELSLRDRRLVTEVVYGVLRNRMRLDYRIQACSSRPLEEVDTTVTWVLRVALYQIEFLRVPDHAAVNEAVESCRQLGMAKAAGFVNAVLRSLLRNQPQLPSGNSATALSVRYSHPEWLVRRYLKRYAVEQAESLLQRNNRPPARFVWVNSFRTTLEAFCRSLRDRQIDYEIYPRFPNCVIVRSSGFVGDPVYQEGLCFFMDPASQEIAHLGDVGQASVVGDFCCAPGGKSFILASRIREGARLYCCDRSYRRLTEVKRRAQFHQVPGLTFLNSDLTRNPPFRTPFDFILVDVPCSGLGTLGSNPDIRWKIRERDLERFHSLQHSILEKSFSVLRPGGELLYATCSTEPEENELVVQQFLAKHPSASLAGDCHRTFPHDHPGDCFFAARIQCG